MRVFAAAYILFVLVTGCSGKTKSATQATAVRDLTVAQATVGAVSTTLVSGTATPNCKPPNMEAVISAMKSKGLPIGQFEVYTAATDQNSLLGRPNQYVAKANFQDSRLALQGTDAFDASNGGSIEVFQVKDDVNRRAKYLADIGKSLPFAVEYDYVEGLVLLRLSQRLTPDQAGQYHETLKTVLLSQ